MAIDAVCAGFMGFDPLKIPIIANAFNVRSYPLCNYGFDDIRVTLDGAEHSLCSLPERYIVPFEPQFGWKGHIEKMNYVVTA